MFLVFGVLLSMMPSTGPNPDAKTMNYTVVVNGAVWSGCLVYYAVDARKWFTGPKITIEGEAAVLGGFPEPGDRSDAEEERERVAEVGKGEKQV